MEVKTNEKFSFCASPPSSPLSLHCLFFSLLRWNTNERLGIKQKHTEINSFVVKKKKRGEERSEVQTRRSGELVGKYQAMDV